MYNNNLLSHQMAHNTYNRYKINERRSQHKGSPPSETDTQTVWNGREREWEWERKGEE